MGARMLFVSVCLLAACGDVAAQTTDPLSGFIPDANEAIRRLSAQSGAAQPPTGPVPSPHPLPPAPREKTADDLLSEIEQLRAQRAELDKKEQELTAALRKKLQQQGERLKKLGLAPQEPDRVGRIIIEGNTKTPDRKILGHLELSPGQILAYQKLEAARVRLEKAGFRDATVEVIPNEQDDAFKDIRIRIVGKKR